MIQGWKDPDAEEIFRKGRGKRWAAIATVLCRKLDMLNAAMVLADLRSPPGNRLEALRGNRAGQHSIRVNDQFLVCFVWTDAGPIDVEVTDYH
jgi:proteic killer suppression protein